MKWRIVIGFFASLILIFFVNGCNEVDKVIDELKRESSSSVSSTEAVDMASLFPVIDEEQMVKHPPQDTVETTASEGKVEATAQDGSVQISKSLVHGSSADGKKVTVDSAAVSAADTQKPLFVDGEFQGIILSVSDRGDGSSDVALRNARYVTEAYKHFELEFKNDGIKQAVQRSLKRSIDRGELQGLYDDINEKPLRFSVVQKAGARSADDSVADIVLRVDIPEGYKIPIEPREVQCSFWDAKCSYTANYEHTSTRKFGKKLGPDYLYVETNGSIEIGIGSYLSAYYDYNSGSDDVFRFTAAQSAYLKSTVTFKIVGDLSKASENGLKWDKEFKMFKDFKMWIPNPYSSVVAQTYISISPVFGVGLSGKLEGTAKYENHFERHGEVRITYDSTIGEGKFTSNVKDNGKNVTKDSLDIAIEADGKCYLFPNLTFIPYVTFLHVDEPVTLVSIQGGIKLDSELKGKIEKGFVVENGTQSESFKGEAALSAAISGLIQGKWMVKVGAKRLYESDDYTKIIATPPYTLLDWKAQFLQPPKITIEEDAQATGTKQVMFSSDDTALLDKLKFFYNFGATEQTTADVPVDEIEQHAKVWQVGNAPLRFDSNGILKVRAVLFNKDVSTALWAWGTSVSAQKAFEINNLVTPKIEPSSKVFSGTLTVTLSQTQGYDIFYKLDNGATQPYSGSFNIDKSVTVTAYAQVDMGGRKLRSETVTATYEKCGDGQKVENDSCVDKTCRDDNFDCPVCQSGETLLFNDDGSGVCMSNGEGNSNTDVNQTITGNTCPFERDKSMPLAEVWTLNDEKVVEYKNGNKDILCFYDSIEVVDALLREEQWTGPSVVKKDYYYNHQLYSYSQYDEDGSIIGESYEYYKDGQIKFFGVYNHGTPIGEHKFWYENGVIYEIDTYQNGKMVTKVQYHESGGEWFVYEFSGDITTLKAYEEDGTLNHTEIFDYDAGTVKFIQANGDCEIWEIDGSKIGDC